jgi:hypothetical protein
MLYRVGYCIGHSENLSWIKVGLFTHTHTRFPHRTTGQPTAPCAAPHALASVALQWPVLTHQIRVPTAHQHRCVCWFNLPPPTAPASSRPTPAAALAQSQSAAAVPLFGMRLSALSPLPAAPSAAKDRHAVVAEASTLGRSFSASSVYARRQTHQTRGC